MDNLDQEEYLDNHFIIFCTKKGIIKKTPLRAFSRPRSGGIIAISIQEQDELLEVNLTDGSAYIMLGTTYGMAVRFKEQDVRSMGRVSTGVRGIRLSQNSDDLVIGMVTVSDPGNTTILTVSEKGFGKRSYLEAYRLVKRGGKGVKTMTINEKTGKLIALKSVSDDEDLMIINKSGIIIRMAVSEVKTAGRDTQGVKLIRLNTGDDIAAVAKLRADEEAEESTAENEEDSS